MRRRITFMNDGAVSVSWSWNAGGFNGAYYLPESEKALEYRKKTVMVGNVRFDER